MGLFDDLLFGREKFCPNCGASVRPKGMHKGSFLAECALWFVGLSAMLFFGWVALLVPGLYSLWRLASAYPGCPECKQGGLIPLDSPRAQSMRSGQSTHPPAN